MSTFFNETVDCPHCGDSATRNLVHSLSVMRSPQYREAILKGTFQVYLCENCEKYYQVLRPFIYIDYDRKELVGVFPLSEQKNWQKCERGLLNAFDLGCGDRTILLARKLGKGMKVRVVFGVRSLREKLICSDEGIDDVVLECLKLKLMGVKDGFITLPEVQPRLIEADKERLLLNGPVDMEGDTIKMETVQVKRRGLYMVEKERKVWPAMLGVVSNSPYTDLGKVMNNF